jgi:hypothetical protein
VGLNDGGAVSRYEREYSYHAGGNLLGWSHAPEGALPGNSWNHEKWVSSTSNRSYLAYDLDGNAVSNPASKFDDKGQLVELPNLRSMRWSPRGQLRKVVLIERTGGDPDDDETYDYAADGKRLRKTTRRLVSGNVETTETVYLDGCELRRIKVSDDPNPTSAALCGSAAVLRAHLCLGARSSHKGAPGRGVRRRSCGRRRRRGGLRGRRDPRSR